MNTSAQFGAATGRRNMRKKKPIPEIMGGPKMKGMKGVPKPKMAMKKKKRSGMSDEAMLRGAKMPA
jgi:hypothetical protein